jgi:hypothetical protein
MSINIKITAPVFKLGEFGSLEKKADVQIAGDFDTFGEGYTLLRNEVENLLKTQSAENTLLLDVRELEKTISSKRRSLEIIEKDIKIAQGQLSRLQNFLERLGIDPSSYSLLIASGPIAATPLGVEREVVDPRPFDIGTDDEDDYEY